MGTSEPRLHRTKGYPLFLPSATTFTTASILIVRPVGSTKVAKADVVVCRNPYDRLVSTCVFFSTTLDLCLLIFAQAAARWLAAWLPVSQHNLAIPLLTDTATFTTSLQARRPAL